VRLEGSAAKTNHRCLGYEFRVTFRNEVLFAKVNDLQPMVGSLTSSIKCTFAQLHSELLQKVMVRLNKKWSTAIRYDIQVTSASENFGGDVYFP
jgi:hypothetical protein